MNTPFPHRYEASLEWQGDNHGRLAAEGRPDLTVGPPPEFGGQSAWWSPEHLLLGAASSCLMATFLAIAAKSSLALEGYRCRAEGVLDRTDTGLGFTSLKLTVVLRVAPRDAARALKLIETAKKYCIVANTLKNTVLLEASVEEKVRAP